MNEPKRPEILLVDDGELDGVAAQLERIGLNFERALGGGESGSLAPATAVVIATPKRAACVRRGSPPEAAPGRPLRVVTVDDELASRTRLLRRTGYHLVVQLPIHDAVWQLLAGHALYAGDERRGDPRVAVGRATHVSHDGDTPDVMLMDVSNRGCRLLASAPFESGQRLMVEVPDREGDEAPLNVPGRVARIGTVDAEAGAPSHVAAVLFDGDLDDDTRMQLGVRINRWSVGPASLCDERSGPSLPACESSEIPGLMLDDETDPAVRVDAAVGWNADTDGERRHRARGRFAVPVVARGRSKRRMLIGRDLSASGMRVEQTEGIAMGDRFMLALHGTDSGEPIIVTATVARDDGEAGIALRFDALKPERAEALDKLVGCLPDLGHDAGDDFGLGAVIGEWLGAVEEDE